MNTEDRKCIIPEAYYNLADSLREILSPKYENQIPHLSEPKLDYNATNQTLLDEFKNVFHLKILNNLSPIKHYFSRADVEGKISSILKSRNLFTDNLNDLVGKSVEISSQMDSIIKQCFNHFYHD